MAKPRGSDSRHDAEILKQAERFKQAKDQETKDDAAAKIREEVRQANEEHPPR